MNGPVLDIHGTSGNCEKRYSCLDSGGICYECGKPGPTVLTRARWAAIEAFSATEDEVAAADAAVRVVVRDFSFRTVADLTKTIEATKDELA